MWRSAPEARFVRPFLGFVVGSVCLAIFTACSDSQNGMDADDWGFLGIFPKWDLVELSLPGPDLNGYSGSPNPFSILLDGTFRGPDGSEHRVPGFYDGDGTGGQSGNVWKIRFTPDQVGDWTVSTSSSEPTLDGQRFAFQVGPSSDHGVLRYTGDFYLKFSDGPYWLKTGADDPEYFLGEDVFGGWDGKRAAVDYLVSKGINSMYMTLLDYPGDSGLVFPWLDVNDQSRLDIAKLKRWESMFSYIRDREIVLHLVLEDDAAVVPADREFYYRTIVARFGYNTGIIWNLREEYNERYTPEQVMAYARLLKTIDPYDHPIALHNQNVPVSWFLNCDALTVASIQTQKPSISLPSGQFNKWAGQWRQEAQAAGRPIMISFDETGKINCGENDRGYARQMIWSLVFGGAQFELHTSPMSNYQEFENLFEDVHRLKKYMSRLHFWEMRPRNDLVSGNAVAFARTGCEMAVFSPDGSPFTVDLSGFSGSLACEWYNPRSGSYVPGAGVDGGGRITMTPPVDGDCVLHLGPYFKD